MKTTIIKAADLTGPALDWAVAKAAGHVLDCDEGAEISGLPAKVWHWAPSENWSQGGPIIERERGWSIRKAKIVLEDE